MKDDKKEDEIAEDLETFDIKTIKLSSNEVAPPEDARVIYNEQTGEVTKPDLKKIRKDWFNSAKHQAKKNERTKPVFANSKALTNNKSLSEHNKKKR